MDDLMDEALDGGRERPIRALRRKRLALLIAEYGGPKALGDKADTTDTHLIAMEKGRRNIGDKLATKLEEACGKPFGWMDGAISPEALRLAQLFDRFTDPAQRDAAVGRAFHVIANDFPEVTDVVSSERLPTSRQTQRS